MDGSEDLVVRRVVVICDGSGVVGYWSGVDLAFRRFLVVHVVVPVIHFGYMVAGIKG